MERPLYYARATDVPPLHERILNASAFDEDCRSFNKISPELLERFRDRLLSGRWYHTSFSSRAIEVPCQFGTTNLVNTLAGTHRVELSRDPHYFSITFIAGTPKPRFTVSISAFSSACNHSTTLEFYLAISIASLERRPVSVVYHLDKYLKPCPHSPAFRRQRWGSHEMSIYLDEIEKFTSSLNKKYPPTQQSLNARGFQS